MSRVNINKDTLAVIIVLQFLLLIGYVVLVNADKINGEPPTASQPPIEQASKTITCQATAFNAYGVDSNGIDYGPGYVIISNKSKIPLYSLLEIDQYGEAQAIGVSSDLAADEIWLWYNAPSKIDMFGTQTVKVKIMEKGDMP